MFCKNSYKLPAEFLSLGRAQAKAFLPQANISQGGGGRPQGTVLTPASLHCAWWRKSNTIRAAEHLRNQEANRGLSAGDLRDICLNETRCSTLPQHKILTPLLPSSKRHDPAYQPGQQGSSREHLQAIKHDMKIFWAKWSLYTGTDVPLWRAGSSCPLAEWQHYPTSPAGKIPALYLQHQKDFTSFDTHKHRVFKHCSWLSAIISDLTAICVLKSIELEWDLLMLALNRTNDSSRAGLNSSPGRAHSPNKRLKAFTLHISSATELWTVSASSYLSYSFVSPLKNDSDSVHLLCRPCKNSLTNLGTVLCR